MKLITNYIPPAAADLIALKNDLGYTGNQMADLAGVASNSQWRKYTGGEHPRKLSSHILFYIAAQLTLDESELKRVLDTMRALGARV